MKPVKPSESRSQRLEGDAIASGIDVVTNVYQGDDGMIPAVITCWQLSLIERLKLLFTGKVYVEQLTKSLPPQKLSISRKEVNLDAVESMPLENWSGAIGGVER